jgi:hypothetical protein
VVLRRALVHLDHPVHDRDIAPVEVENHDLARPRRRLAEV